MPKEDVNRVMGAKVYANDVRVISMAECSWSYELISKRKEVLGVVLKV